MLKMYIEGEKSLDDVIWAVYVYITIAALDTLKIYAFLFFFPLVWYSF